MYSIASWLTVKRLLSLRDFVRFNQPAEMEGSWGTVWFDQSTDSFSRRRNNATQTVVEKLNCNNKSALFGSLRSTFCCHAVPCLILIEHIHSPLTMIPRVRQYTIRNPTHPATSITECHCVVVITFRHEPPSIRRRLLLPALDLFERLCNTRMQSTPTR